MFMYTDYLRIHGSLSCDGVQTLNPVHEYSLVVLPSENTWPELHCTVQVIFPWVQDTTALGIVAGKVSRKHEVAEIECFFKN